MQNTNASLTYCLTTVGLDKSIGRAFLIFPAPHGPDRTRLRQMNRMARHKRYQRLQSATKLVETLRPKSTFWRFPDFEREKDSFSSPIPSMQCCATVRATFRKQETSQLWMEGTGEGCGFLCSLKLPYLSTMSQQFCRRLSESQNWRHILEKMNSAHVFVLGCKTPGGFLFAMFNVVMPIWEQLENGDFVIFCA